MRNKKDQDQDLPEAANQKEIEERLKTILGPNADESTHEEAEWLRMSQKARPKPEKPAEATVQPEAAPGAPSLAEATEATTVDEESKAGEVPTSDVADSDEPDAKPEAEDTETKEAVDDIVAEEGDEVLAAEDEELAKAFTKQENRSFKNKIKDFWTSWWANPKKRYTTIGVVIATLLAACIIPASRYFVLNTAGVRGSASVVILDNSTQQPLKNVTVKVGSISAVSNSEGIARLNHIRLGKAQLVIEKRAFAPASQNVVIGWGSNPLGSIALKAVGAQYTFFVKDWLSDKPIEKAEASSGEASAVSDRDGKIVLTVDPAEAAKLDVSLKASAYRDESLSQDTSNKAPQTVAMVSNRKEVFVSKRSGRYDLYKVDIDGKNEDLVLKATGYEQDNMAIISHPTDEITAYVSTRDNVRNKDGFLLSTMLLIDLKDNSTTNLAQSERIQPLGWLGDSLIYAQIAAGASANNPKRHRLMSYNYKTGEKKELAASNSFNDAMIAADNIYYAPSSQAGSSAGLFKSNADGTNKLSIMNQEIWSMFRTAYDTLNLSVQQEWYEYKLGDLKARKLSGAPANTTSRVYIDSPDKKHSLWIDQRDGKGVLLVYDTAAKTDKTLLTQSGLNNPLRWLNDHTVIFRVRTDQESADYVMNLDGGTAKKIKDVTNSLGIDRWYYY